MNIFGSAVVYAGLVVALAGLASVGCTLRHAAALPFASDFTRTAGALSPEEADELERVIEEGCERIDEHGW